MAELDGLRKVTTFGMAVVDSLLGQPEVGGECFRGEELVHGSRCWAQSHDCIQYRRVYLHLQLGDRLPFGAFAPLAPSDGPVNLKCSAEVEA